MKSLTSVGAFVVLGLVLAPPFGNAQEDRKKSQAEHGDAPGPVHHRLDDLAGTWDVVVRYTIGDKEHEGTANCEAKWILDGRFLEQVYKSRFQGKPYEVIQLLGYDNVGKKTIEIKLDNMSTGIMHNEGSISEDGNVITNVGKSLDPATGKPYKLRTVTTVVDHDHFTLEWYGTEEGGKEAKVVSMSHTRKKK
jgi:Protein of unknown function (DUF1579)